MINKKSIPLFALISAFAAPVYAQLNLPNPLVEPLSRQKGNQPTPDRATSLPALPDGLPGGRGSGLTDVVAGNAESKKETALVQARTQLSSFNVVAIVGNKAILRRLAGQNGAASTPGISQMSGGQIPLATATSPSGQSASSNSNKSESLTIKDGDSFSYIVGNGSLLGSVKGDRVVIYLDSVDTKGAAHKDVVFAGELQATIAQAKTITLQTKDADYKTAINIKADSNSTSNNTSNSNTNPNSGSNSGNSNNSGSSQQSQ